MTFHSQERKQKPICVLVNQRNFNLKRYPFDTQTCYIELAMRPLDKALERVLDWKIDYKFSEKDFQTENPRHTFRKLRLEKCLDKRGRMMGEALCYSMDEGAGKPMKPRTPYILFRDDYHQRFDSRTDFSEIARYSEKVF